MLTSIFSFFTRVFGTPSYEESSLAGVFCFEPFIGAIIDKRIKFTYRKTRNTIFHGPGCCSQEFWISSLFKIRLDRPDNLDLHSFCYLYVNGKETEFGHEDIRLIAALRDSKDLGPNLGGFCFHSMGISRQEVLRLQRETL